MTFPSIVNRGEFFSNHYLDSVISSDLDDLRRRWNAQEKGDVPTGRARIRGMPREFFAARQLGHPERFGQQSDQARMIGEGFIESGAGFRSRTQSQHLRGEIVDDQQTSTTVDAQDSASHPVE